MILCLDCTKHQSSKFFNITTSVAPAVLNANSYEFSKQLFPES